LNAPSEPTEENGRVPMVSVIIPTYNRAVLVVNAIESVLQQTFTDYELIVIDDGSTDDTRARLEPYMRRIRYFYQPNRGASAAQNAGIREARGQWIAILASDDTWLPSKLEKQFDALEKLGAEYGACFTNCKFIGRPGQVCTCFEEVGIDTIQPFAPLPKPTEYLVGKFGLYVQAMLARRSLVTEVGGFDEALGISEDRDLIFRLTFRTRFCFVSAPLVEIDRTLFLPRLTDLSGYKPGHSHSCLEYVLKKWLASPELVDSENRRMIEKELIGLYYGGAAEWLGDLKPAAALENINKIRGMGYTYPRILVTLLSRAARKVSRTLRGRFGGH
jgi:glycosyltransferase involved in cell wall biosynthesis